MKTKQSSFLNTPAGYAVCLMLAALAIFLWVEYRLQVADALPLFLPLLICIGLHFFMHRAHGGHGDGK